MESSQDRQTALLFATAQMGIATALYRNQLAKAAGVSLTESLCLTLLGVDPRLSPSALARIIGLSPGAMTTLLDRLETRGFIVRRLHAEDRRRVVVELAAGAVAPAQQSVADVQAAQRALVARMRPEELSIVEAYLNAFTDNLRALSDDVRQALGSTEVPLPSDGTEELRQPHR